MGSGMKFIRVHGRVVPVKASGNKPGASQNKEANSHNATKAQAKPKMPKMKVSTGSTEGKSKISSGGSISLLGIHHYLKESVVGEVAKQTAQIGGALALGAGLVVGTRTASKKINQALPFLKKNKKSLGVAAGVAVAAGAASYFRLKRGKPLGKK
jgi:hypothetical protein